MQIVGGELYCEIFSRLLFSIFIFFQMLKLKKMFSNYLCSNIFNFILDALLNPY